MVATDSVVQRGQTAYAYTAKPKEASRLCDLVGGTYAVLIGPGFPRAAETDGEVQPTASPSGRATIW